MFKNINLFNAIAFALVFLIMFESITLSISAEEEPEKRKPQWLIFALSLLMGSIAGLDRQPLTSPIRR